MPGNYPQRIGCGDRSLEAVEQKIAGMSCCGHFRIVLAAAITVLAGNQA